MWILQTGRVSHLVHLAMSTSRLPSCRHAEVVDNCVYAYQNQRYLIRQSLLAGHSIKWKRQEAELNLCSTIWRVIFEFTKRCFCAIFVMAVESTVSSLTLFMQLMVCSASCLRRIHPTNGFPANFLKYEAKWHSTVRFHLRSRTTNFRWMHQQLDDIQSIVVSVSSRLHM